MWLRFVFFSITPEVSYNRAALQPFTPLIEGVMAEPLPRWHGLDEDQSVRPRHHQVLGPPQNQAQGAAPLCFGRRRSKVDRRLRSQAQQDRNRIPRAVYCLCLYVSFVCVAGILMAIPSSLWRRYDLAKASPHHIPSRRYRLLGREKSFALGYP